jgi:lysophospholipase L1-like esterase
VSTESGQIFSRFVAIGDSQTEGVGDIPNRDGTDRGWADRFAGALAEGNPGLLYANLAVRGRTARQVLDGQLEAAAALEPDLVSVIAGMNDLIRPGFDPDEVLDLLDTMERRFIDQGATVMTITYPDADGLGPLGSLIEDRVRAFNEGIREVGRANGTLVLDLEPIKATADPRLWRNDRLHLNPDGHERMAQGMLSLVAPDLVDEAWRVPLPPEPDKSGRGAFMHEAEWFFRYLAPWIGRRITGRSSGDGRVAKRPTYGPPPPREA